MREKSRMSLMSVRRVSPEQRTVLTRSHCAGDSAVSASSCPTAIIPFRGVRISWLMRAKNCDFASAEAAACMAGMHGKEGDGRGHCQQLPHRYHAFQEGPRRMHTGTCSTSASAAACA